MREVTVEQRLIAHARTRRGVAFKLAPTVAGLPDRMVVLPGGRIFLVELKAPNGKLSPVQRHIHDLFASLGVEVVVLYTLTQVDEWFATLS